MTALFFLLSPSIALKLAEAVFRDSFPWAAPCKDHQQR